MLRHFLLNGKSIPLNELPEDVLVGWLGHIMDYLKRSDMALIVFGFLCLFSKRFVILAERAAESYAVTHGLGDYVLRTKNFILNEASMPESYIKRMKNLYLPPEEIMGMMDEKAASK